VELSGAVGGRAIPIGHAFLLINACNLFKSQMKAVILVGGLGTRISEETQNCPKPMVQIGYPNRWHEIYKCEKHVTK
jgi:hypothetical protein